MASVVKPSFPRLRRSHRLAQGLLAAFAFGEGSGGTLYDAVLGNNAIWQGAAAPSWGGSSYGSALAFSGASAQYAQAPFRLSYQTAYASVFAVVRCDAIQGPGGQEAIVVNRNYDGTSVPLNLSVGGTNNSGFGFYNGTWRTSGLTANIVNDGLFHAVSGTYDGTTLSYYLDGKLDASALYTGTIPILNTNALDIGRYGNDAALFPGAIACVYLYNRALAIGEITALTEDPFAIFRPDRTVLKPAPAVFAGDEDTGICYYPTYSW